MVVVKGCYTLVFGDKRIRLEDGLVRVRHRIARLELIAGQLLEAFEACRNLDRHRLNFIVSRPDVVSFARPAYDVYIGIRTLATYAVMRERLGQP